MNLAKNFEAANKKSQGWEYDSNKIFTFQPGKGFTCVASVDEKDLGTIVDGVNGININQYFEDKKEKQKAKLPAVIQKQGILSKLKGLFASLKEKRNNSKYIDDSIVARDVTPSQSTESEKSKFQSELEKGIPSKFKIVEQENRTIAELCLDVQL